MHLSSGVRPEQDGSQSVVTLNSELSQVQRTWRPGSSQRIRGGGRSAFQIGSRWNLRGEKLKYRYREGRQREFGLHVARGVSRRKWQVNLEKTETWK